MKRLLIIFLIAILTITLISGCGRNEEEQEEIITEEEESISEENEPIDINEEEESVEQEKEEKEEIEESEIKVGVFPGDRAYDFTLEDREGNEVSLSDYKGKVVFVNFWASWCPPCIAEMPYIQNLYEKYKDSDEAAVLTINLTKAEKNGVEDANEYLDENNYTFPVLLDTEGEIAVKYRVANIPTTYIIDKDGIIYNYIVGPMSEDRMVDQIEGAIEGEIQN